MRRALKTCEVKPHGQRFSLVAGISQAHVKQGSICDVLGGLQAKCCGDSKEREITFDLFFTTGILVVFLLVPLW